MSLRRLGCGMALALGLLGCADDRDDERVLDVLATSTTTVFDRIDSDPTWQVTTESGAVVAGVLENETGTLSVSGWRTGGQHEGGGGLFTGFSEKLYFEYTNYTELGSQLSGTIALTRHSMDRATTDGQVTDASRAVVYQGTLLSTGDLAGTFDIDVHSHASGAVAWTCGTINGEPVGAGACY